MACHRWSSDDGGDIHDAKRLLDDDSEALRSPSFATDELLQAQQFLFGVSLLLLLMNDSDFFGSLIVIIAVHWRRRHLSPTLFDLNCALSFLQRQFSFSGCLALWLFNGHLESQFGRRYAGRGLILLGSLLQSVVVFFSVMICLR